MKRVAYYFWLIPDERTGKLKKTRWRMAECETPGAVRLDDTLEWRDVPEPGDTGMNWPLVPPPDTPP